MEEKSNDAVERIGSLLEEFNEECNAEKILMETEPLSPENTLIGSFLIDPLKIEECLDLTREHFLDSDNFFIYEVLKEEYKNNRPIDIVTISDLLRKSHRHLLSYILTLFKSVYTTSHFSAYLHLFKQHWQNRKLLEIGKKLIQNASQEEENTIEIAQKQLSAIIQQSSKELIFRKDCLAQILQEIEERTQQEGFKGIATGFIDLDKITQGFQLGDLIILAARPSIGKTTLAMNIADYVSLHLNKTVLFFSMEMNKNQIIERSIASLTKIPADRLQSGKLSADEYEKISQYLTAVSNDHLIIEDNSSLFVHEIRNYARKVQKEHGLSLIIIDHLNFISGTGENETLKIGAITRDLKRLARDLKIPVLTLCQLNRGVEHRPNKRPTLSDLRQSGRIEEDADLVLMLYRDEYYDNNTPNKGVAELILTKHRNGAVGTVFLTFQGQFCRFDNYSGYIADPIMTHKSRDLFHYPVE